MQSLECLLWCFFTPAMLTDLCFFYNEFLVMRIRLSLGMYRFMLLM